MVRNYYKSHQQFKLYLRGIGKKKKTYIKEVLTAAGSQRDFSLSASLSYRSLSN